MKTILTLLALVIATGGYSQTMEQADRDVAETVRRGVSNLTVPYLETFAKTIREELDKMLAPTNRLEPAYKVIYREFYTAKDTNTWPVSNDEVIRWCNQITNYPGYYITTNGLDTFYYYPITFTNCFSFDITTNCPFQTVRDTFNGYGRLKGLIQFMASKGDICEVLGHNWRDGRLGEAEGIRFLDYRANTYFRTCRNCGKGEKQNLEWK